MQSGTGNRTVWIAAAVVVAFNALLVAWAIFQPAGPLASQAVMSTGGVVGPLLALPLCYWGYREAFRTGGWRWAPVLLGLGILSYTLGRIVFTYYMWVLDRLPPMPSFCWAYYCYYLPALLPGLPVRESRSTGS